LDLEVRENKQVVQHHQIRPEYLQLVLALVVVEQCQILLVEQSVEMALLEQS
jgi:hypothetical protein